MSLQQLDTPTKRRSFPASGQNALQSCLKPKPGSRNSNPQVRFSLPPRDDEVMHQDGGKCDYTCNIDFRSTKFGENKSQARGQQPSPLKIVYPKSSIEDFHGHFVDLHNKVALQLSTDIWSSHNREKESKGIKNTMGHARYNSIAGLSPYTPTASPEFKKHNRSQSLQSIIYTTVQDYRSSPPKVESLMASRFEHKISNPSETVAAAKPACIKEHTLSHHGHQLYLRQDSPLNKYKVTVPLELQVPPFLSPENKHKQTKRLIYDGHGYSAYREDDNEGSDVDNDSEQSKLNLSDLSIPSATNVISIDLSIENLDDTLGIDQFANVNLRKQVQNMSKNSPSRTGFNDLPSTPVHGPLSSAETRRNSRIQATPQQLMQDTYAKVSTPVFRGVHHDKNQPIEPLEILSTPTRLITIPDFEKEPAPRRRNVLSGFFSMEEVPDEPLPDYNVPRDRLNEGFKFPQVAEPLLNTSSPLSPKNRVLEASAPENHSDFLKVPGTMVNSSFEKRRSVLQKQNILGHQHRRSRSVHRVEDMMSAGYGQSTPPLPSAIVSPIPQMPTYKPQKQDSSTIVRTLQYSPLNNDSSFVASSHNLETPEDATNDDPVSPVVQVCAKNLLYDKKGSDNTESFKVSVSTRDRSIDRGDDYGNVDSFIFENNSSNNEPTMTGIFNNILTKKFTKSSSTVRGSPNTKNLSKHSHKDKPPGVSMASEFFDTRSGKQKGTSELLENSGTFRPFDSDSIQLIDEYHVPAENSLVHASAKYVKRQNLVQLEARRPNSNDSQPKSFPKQKVGNVLDPTRRLSNGFSHSSYESDLSTPSGQVSHFTSVTSLTASEIDNSNLLVKTLSISHRNSGQAGNQYHNSSDFKHVSTVASRNGTKSSTSQHMGVQESLVRRPLVKRESMTTDLHDVHFHRKSHSPLNSSLLADSDRSQKVENTAFHKSQQPGICSRRHPNPIPISPLPDIETETKPNPDNAEFHTVFEPYEGKLVEIIVLDDETESSKKHSFPSPPAEDESTRHLAYLYRTSHKRDSLEIRQLYEDESRNGKQGKLDPTKFDKKVLNSISSGKGGPKDENSLSTATASVGRTTSGNCRNTTRNAIKTFERRYLHNLQRVLRSKSARPSEII
ncbi:Fir1p Ecym_1206 [Eremothecium cymbalariae DBVPG|uniref:Uncharacterized protein n=1 Tax=Eremothecium cymbalariae (strain CBS 270.75 / DBVPG 7215 / KCTC 17166 / NRRL Y-17582) TaxID=931890 RepID=G8JMY9_ERECY|nr:hypothetical protein Ecym_1206 [Eremothecium cymbalariae DBVPG\